MKQEKGALPEYHFFEPHPSALVAALIGIFVCGPAFWLLYVLFLSLPTVK